ncbi:MAG TPA: hypothetical protein VN706_19915 [Gemmatimonadaceae bacterium]|nr:hypothetical protein [Gemmatimonadaceae bacterium]
MSDFRQDRSDKFRQQLNERGNPHGGRGRRAENNIAEQFETQTGHPLGETASNQRGDQLAGDLPPSIDLRRDQHARKGQAQSPRERNLNQPEKKIEGHGRHHDK